MNRAYVVTEGQFDLSILKLILPEDIVKNVEFIAGSGRYAAQSLARSILAVKQLPTALVLDADTEDEVTIQEQMEFLREALNQASAGVPFEIFLAVPEIEILLVQDMTFLQRITHRKLSKIEWEMAKSHPKEFLNRIPGIQDSFVELLKNLDQDTVEIVRKHPLLSQLARFLAAVIYEKQ